MKRALTSIAFALLFPCLANAWTHGQATSAGARWRAARSQASTP